MKNMIFKVTSDHEDIYEALQVYRNTPLEPGKSPAELLFGRNIRSNLPVVKSQLKPQSPSSVVTQKKQEIKQRQKRHYNKHTANLKPLKTGDFVRLQNMDKPSINKPRWSQKGVITKVLPNRSYNVRTETGEVLRRNRRHLLASSETEEPDEWYDATEEPPANQELPAADQHQPSEVRRSSRESRPNTRYFNNQFVS